MLNNKIYKNKFLILKDGVHEARNERKRELPDPASASRRRVPRMSGIRETMDRRQHALNYPATSFDQIEQHVRQMPITLSTGDRLSCTGSSRRFDRSKGGKVTPTARGAHAGIINAY